MPIHDWTKVEAGIFHDFHSDWIQVLKRALNSGLLPPQYYFYCNRSQSDITRFQALCCELDVVSSCPRSHPRSLDA